MKAINAIRMGGAEVLPLVEGGKGVAVSNGASCGAWAVGRRRGHLLRRQRRQLRRGRAASSARPTPARPGATGTRSWWPTASPAASRRRGKRTSAPAARAASTPTSCGRWAARSGSSAACWKAPRAIVSGITCGAGMPYRLADIAREFNVFYYPIISSARAFSALWKRSYSKARDWLGGVVYEDPWLAGGHNGLSNSEDPLVPEDPYPARPEAAPADARVRPGRRADHHGRRRLVAGGMGGLDRQPRARPHRLPVRHPAAADAGKPDLATPGSGGC